MADTYLPNRAGDAQRKLDELRAENTRLVEDHERLKRTVALMEEQYLKAHGGSWGECRFQAENTRLSEELAKAKALPAAWVPHYNAATAARDAALAANTPLRARVAALESALRRVEWVYYATPGYEGRKCYACGALTKPGAGHAPGCTTEAALAGKPAVTGTTSDKEPFRQQPCDRNGEGRDGCGRPTCRKCYPQPEPAPPKRTPVAGMYPPGWPRCACGDYALDGRATCGRVECSR